MALFVVYVEMLRIGVVVPVVGRFLVRFPPINHLRMVLSFVENKKILQPAIDPQSNPERLSVCVGVCHHQAPYILESLSVAILIQVFFLCCPFSCPFSDFEKFSTKTLEILFTSLRTTQYVVTCTDPIWLAIGFQLLDDRAVLL